MDWSPLDLPLTDPRHPFHVHHMEMALDEAAAAAAEDEVPVGAVIVSFERGLAHRDLGAAAPPRGAARSPGAALWPGAAV